MPTFRSLSFIWKLFRFSFVSLPYFYFAVFPGLIAVIALLYAKFRQSALDRATRNLLLVLTGLLSLSCLFAENRGEAFLQLANFLPYLLLFSVLPYLLKGTEPLTRLATDVVIATIPINLLALLEYVLRAEGIPRWLRRTALSRWYRARPHAGRAMVMFGHPNALAGYLVLVLGLGLGLILYYLWQRRSVRERQTPLLPNWQMVLLYIGTFSCLLGIFASGSRNGLLVAMAQLLVFSLFTKASRIVLISGAVGLVGLITGAAWLGIGGRSLSLADWADDPRVGVWRFAFSLLKQRPFLGWGLGNYKLQYPPGLIPDYDYVAHPHNFWLLLAVEAGIPVMLLFTLFVGRICYRAVKQLWAKSTDSGEQAVLLAYLLSFAGCVAFALFDVTFYDARINVTNWVVLAGLYSLRQDEQFNSNVIENFDSTNP
jgi:O-antigen ligase